MALIPISPLNGKRRGAQNPLIAITVHHARSARPAARGPGTTPGGRHG